MFSSLNKSTFGTSTSAPTFGFGTTSTTNQTPFGQNQFFGKSNTGGFGQTTPLFGSTPQQNTGTLFSNTALPSFGGNTQQTGFGTGLFGQQQNVSSGTNGLFTSSATSTFGQQNKTPSFGFGASGSSLFGQQQTQNFQPSTSGTVFGGTPGFGATAPMGTVIKFNPATGSDTMQKSGITHSINTKHHCITCMKEYETKSLEELRWEDYQANRKGPQNGFGGAPFGAPASTAASIFGQTDNKTAFGQTSTFGNPSASAFNMGNQGTPSLFGKPNTGFGTTPTTNSFNFNTNSSAFGASTIGKTFGTPSTQNVFGTAATSQAPANFGTNLFPNTSQNAGNIFGKTTTQSVFTNQQPLFAFNQPSTTQTSFFQTSKPSTGFGSFGSSNLTTTSSFGQPSNLFSSQTPQNPFNAMQKPGQSTFGQPIQPGFGLGAQGNTNTFFGGNKSLFGGNQQNSFFNTSNNGFMMNQQQPSLNLSMGFDLQTTQDFHNHVEQIYDPFPHYDFLLDSLKRNTHNTTDPQTLKEILDQAPMPVTNIEKNISKYRTLIKPRTMLSYPGSKYALLDDLVDKTSQNLSFKNGKRLVLRKNVPKTEKDMLGVYKKMIDSEDTKNKSLFRNIQQVDNEKYDVLEQTKLILETEFISQTPLLENDGINSSLNNNKLSFEETPVRDKVTNKPNAKIVLMEDNTENKAQQKLGDEETDNAKLGKHANNPPMTDESIGIELGVTPIDESSTNSDSDNDLLIEEESKIETSLTCGVKLTQPDCYTIPPLTELHKYKNDKGECIVKGFTIGRTGYGSIFFPDAMDIANLDLNEIVKFRFREITVYPDDHKKPPVGQGLNRKAQVTLERVWPRDKITHETIRDAKEILKTNFIDRLSSLAEKQNAVFQNYHPETGSWIFTVDHFSKYKYLESSDDEQDDSIFRPKLHFNRGDAPSLDISEHLEWRGLGGIDHKELSTNGDEDGSSFIYSPDITCTKLGKSAFVLKSSFFDEDSFSDESSCDAGVFYPFHATSKHTPSPLKEKLIYEEVKTYSLLYQHEKTITGINNFLYNSYVDIACFKGRSFKVGWSQGFKFITNTSIQFGGTILPAEEDISISNLHILDISKEIIGNNIDIWKNHLEAIFELTVFEEDLDVPICSLSSGLDFLNKFNDLGCILQHGKHSVNYLQIWSLCKILWGAKDLSLMEKRELFSTWLKKHLPPFDLNTEDLTGTDATLTSLLKYYLTNNMSAASQLAIDSDMPAFSLLLAQQQESTSKYLIKQHKLWQHNDVMEHIDDALLKMYTLLGGSGLIYGPFSVFYDLNWKQTLAQYLWHISSPTASIANVVAEYSDSFAKHDICTKPLTEYKKDIPFLHESKLELQYHLLELYSNLSTDLCEILDPYCYSRYSCDFHLSWCLMLLFDLIKVGKSNYILHYTICTNFAAQLEAVGEWTWAIFVLLFIKKKKLKLHAIKSLLTRHIDKIKNEDSKYVLTQKFKISPKVIHSVLSYDYKQNYFEAYEHFILSGQMKEATRIMQADIIPELIINRKLKNLHCLLNHLKSYEYYPVIPLIYNFLYLFSEYVTFKKQTTPIGIEYARLGLKTEIIGFAQLIKDFPNKTIKDRLCVAELSRQIETIFAIACGENEEIDIKSELCIPEDYYYIRTSGEIEL